MAHRPLIAVPRAVQNLLAQRAQGIRNRRASGRLKSAGTLRCNLGTVVDLSSTGLRISCGRRRKGTLKVRLTTSRRRVVLYARVVWSKRTGLFRHECGLEFIEVTPELAAELTQIAIYLRTG